MARGPVPGWAFAGSEVIELVALLERGLTLAVSLGLREAETIRALIVQVHAVDVTAKTLVVNDLRTKDK